MDPNVKGGMSWLYDPDSGKPKDEDYLLGKAVDSNVEARGTEGQINAVEYDCTPESIFASQAQHQVDLQRKLQEDPLISLRMREVDTRKKILDNPLKMREIHRYIESMKKKKHKKKEKKRKKHRKVESDEGDQDLDAKLLERLKRKVFEEEDEAWVPKDELGRHGSPPSRSSSKRRLSDAEGQRRHRQRPEPWQADSSSDSDGGRSRQRRRRRHSSKDVSRERRREGRSEGSSRTAGGSHKMSMSCKEKDNRLQEMMDNARWREDNRSRNVKKYQQEEKVEELEVKQHRDDDSFVRNQLLRAAADASSVEKRLQSNRHNIQRGVSSMTENFAKR